MRSTILYTKALEKTYAPGTSLETKALKATDVSFEQGRFYAIIGKSGSGKSTLLHLLGGLDRPTGGEVFLEGKSLFELKEKELAVLRRRRIGFVFQAYNLLGEHTALENICMPLNLDRKEPDKDFFDSLTKSLGIDDKLKKYPDELSGGEQQRVAIARAMITKPAILLADEPTGNLDPVTGAGVIELLKRLAEEHDQTVLLVTHDMDIAKKADVIVTMHDGNIVSIEEGSQEA